MNMEHGTPFRLKKYFMERDRESILSVSRAAMDHGRAQASCVSQPAPPLDVCLESGDIIQKWEDDADVAPEVDGVSDGTFRWREREA